jgi:hypothetical protein
MVDPKAPEFVRVGKTDRPPKDTAQESNLQLRDAVYFSDCGVAAGFVHEYLETFHSANDPELFEVPVEIALKALSLAMERHVGTRANLPLNSSLYEDGPVAEDGTTAASLYEQAVHLRAGQDTANALKYYKRAARLGEPRAFLALAEMTERGEGVPADEGRATEWLVEGTRAGVRECWGALADRHPQTKYLRPFFQGIELSALTPDQKQAVLRRLRLYVQVASTRFEPDDEPVIEAALDQLENRELKQNWARAKRGAGSGGGGDATFKWSVGLAVAIGIGLLIPTALRQFGSKAEPPKPEQTEAPKPEEKAIIAGSPVTPGAPKPKPKARAGLAAAPVMRGAAPAGVASPAKSAVQSAPAAEPPKAPESSTWLTKAPPAPAEAPPKGREISGEELREQFNWSKEKATEAFKDAVVKVTETVTKVGKHDLSFKKIKCKFAGEPPARIQEGMTVTVEGTVQGKSRWTGTIVMEQCRVLP